MVVAVGNDLGGKSGSQQRMTAGNKVGEDVGNDVGNNNGRVDGGQWWG